jgi:hypothetical protein
VAVIDTQVAVAQQSAHAFAEMQPGAHSVFRGNRGVARPNAAISAI